MFSEPACHGVLIPLSFVEIIKFSHFFSREFEAPDIQVLPDPLPITRLGKQGTVVLETPA